MDDELPEAQWSGDPVLSEEARRLRGQYPDRAEDPDRAEVTGCRGCLVWLGMVIGVGGPFVAIFSMMGGDELVLPIAVGSCGLAGLSLAVIEPRISRGALRALAFPLIWLVVAAGLVFSNGAPDAPPAEMTFYLVGFLLIQAASVEAGYLTGRLIAELIQDHQVSGTAR